MGKWLDAFFLLWWLIGRFPFREWGSYRKNRPYLQIGSIVRVLAQGAIYVLKRASTKPGLSTESAICQTLGFPYLSFDFETYKRCLSQLEYYLFLSLSTSIYLSFFSQCWIVISNLIRKCCKWSLHRRIRMRKCWNENIHRRMKLIVLCCCQPIPTVN